MFNYFKDLGIKNRNYYILCLIRIFQTLIFFVPIQTLFYQSRDISLSNIYSLESILLFTIIVFEVPWGWVADRTSYKTTLVISNGIAAFGILLMYLLCGFEAFAVVMFIKGISLAGRSGCDTALIYESIDESSGEKAYGLYQTFSISGILISSVLSGFISKISIDLTVLATFITYLIGFLLSFFLKNVKTEKKDKEGVNLKSAFKEISDLRFIFTFVLATTIVTEAASILVVYLNQLQFLRCNIGIEYFGIIVGLGQVLGLFSYRINEVTSKFGKKNTILCIISIIALSCFTLIMTKDAILSVILFLIIETSNYFVYPILTDVENKSIKNDSKNRATVLSIYSVIGSIVSVVINLIISYVSDNSLIMSFAFCLIISVIAFILVITLKKDKINCSENKNF